MNRSRMFAVTLSALLFTTGARVQATGQPFVWPAGWSDAKPGEARRGGQFRDEYIAFDTFNPFTDLDSGGGSVNLSRGTTGLYRIDPATRQFVPYMAQSAPSISADGRVYTFSLRPGMQFSDGTLVTAEDFVTTWRIHTDKDVQSPLRGSFFNGDQPITLKALNPSTLQVTFPVPVATAGSILSFAPWPAHVFGPVYARGGAKAIRAMWGTDVTPGQIVTAGAWKLGVNDPNKEVVYTRNPYWGKWNTDSAGQPLPYLDGIHVQIVKDDGSALDDFLSGKVDIGFPSTADEVQQVQSAVTSGKLNATLLTGIGTRNSVFYLIFNWNRASDPFRQALFRDVRFRRAISHLIDRQKIVDQTLGGQGQPVYSEVPALHAAFIPGDLPRYSYDPAAATRLLEQMGFTRKDADGYLVNAQGQRVEFGVISYPDPNVAKQMALFTADARAAGVKVTFRALPADEMFALVDGEGRAPNDRNFDSVVYANGGFDGTWPFDPSVIACGGPGHDFNRSGECLTPEEKQIEVLDAQGRRETNPERRAVTGQTLMRLLAEQQEFIPLFSGAYVAAYNNRLGGAYPRALINVLNRDRALPLTFVK